MSDSMTVAQASGAELTVRHGMTPAEAAARWDEVVDVIQAARAVGDADTLVRLEQLLNPQEESTMADQDANKVEEKATERTVTEQPDSRTTEEAERTTTTVRDADTDSDE